MKIVFLNGNNTGKSVDLTPSGLTIGRETDNHLQLPVGGVSRYHARIEFVDGAYMLRDLGSTNGTKLNGSALQKPESLKANDIIVIGEQQLRVDDSNSESGKTESKPGVCTVKIPAGIPVPEPAVPQFVFRPDSEPQPPPPPPVTDSSENTAINIAPEVTEAGNDFFAKHDNDGNFFKKEKTPKESGKSSLLGNLIFALVIMIMICGGVLVFKIMNSKGPDDKKSGKTRVPTAVENNDFFFYYEAQIVDRKSQQLIRKKAYCRQVDGKYCLDMFYDDNDAVRVQKTVLLEDATIKRHKEQDDIKDYAERDTMVSVDSGNELEWTRLAIGVGSKVYDSTVTGSSKDSLFRRAEEKVVRLILQTGPGKLMMSADELRAEAEINFGRAGNFYRNRENNPVDYSRALFSYMDALEYYSAIRKHSSRDEENLLIAGERAKELNLKLKQVYDDNVSKADIAFAQKNYNQARKLCMEAKKYFISDSKEWNELSRMENACVAKSREQQKGKK